MLIIANRIDIRSRRSIDGTADAYLMNKTDWRLPLDAYTPIVWSRDVEPLVAAMYGETSVESRAWAATYRQKFWALFADRNDDPKPRRPTCG